MPSNSHIPNYKYEQDGKTIVGEKHGEFLWTNEGVKSIPKDAVLQEIPFENITTPYCPFCTRPPETGFEIFQLERHGNFIADTEDLSDELRQSDVAERYIQFNLDK